MQKSYRSYWHSCLPRSRPGNKSRQAGEIEMPNPGIGWTWIVNLLVKVLGGLFPSISEQLRTELQEFLLGYYKKALETPNPWDDFLARFLLRILDIPVPE